MKNIIIILVTGAVLIFGCKRKGCTDPNATNYEAHSKDDDGSCTYSATLSFWYDSITSVNFESQGIDMIEVFVENESFFHTTTNTFLDSEPDCSHPDIFKFGIEVLGQSQNVNYSVKNQNGIEIINATTTVKADSCLSVQLIH
ncbi:MAG: hypothetical protein H6598_03030 [Flavobacteriales bacterium]|nr:hypothetical protein [Flavobacteriales bacterium]